MTNNVQFKIGYGRHSKEEVYDIGRADLKAFNDIIGTNKFIFGYEVSDVDAALFGILAQVMFNDRGPLNDYLISNFFFPFNTHIIDLFTFFIYLKILVQILFDTFKL